MAIISDGTTIADAASFSVSLGNMVLLNTATASNSASLSFNSTYITSTYPIYKFEFINIHPATNSAYFQVNLSIDNGSNYNVEVTNTLFRAYHRENGDNPTLTYETGADQAQGTAFIRLDENDGGNDNDHSASGILKLYNPSSTTFIKHYVGRVQYSQKDDYSINTYTQGYFNTTSAINNIQFKMGSGEIQGGTIQVFGVA